MSDKREPPMTRDEFMSYAASSRGDVHRLLLYIGDLHHIIRENVRYIDMMGMDQRYRDYYATIVDRAWDLPTDESETT